MSTQRGYFDMSGLIPVLLILGALAGLGMWFGTKALWQHALKPAAQWAVCECAEADEAKR